jgi:hypothetical protein
MYQNPCYVDRRDIPWSLLQKYTAGDNNNHSPPLDQQVMHTPNRPLWIADRIGKEIMNIPITNNFSSRERLSLLKSVEHLTATIGQCERIHQVCTNINERNGLMGMNTTISQHSLSCPS